MVDRKFASNELLGSSTNKVGLQHLTETQLRSGALDSFVPRRRESYVAHIRRDEPVSTLSWDTATTARPRPASAAPSTRDHSTAARKARRKRIAAASGRLREQLQRLQYARESNSGGRMVVTGTVSQSRPQSAAPARAARSQSKAQLAARPASAASSRQSSASAASGVPRSLPGGATAAYGHTRRGGWGRSTGPRGWLIVRVCAPRVVGPRVARFLARVVGR